MRWAMHHLARSRDAFARCLRLCPVCRVALLGVGIPGIGPGIGAIRTCRILPRLHRVARAQPRVALRSCPWSAPAPRVALSTRSVAPPPSGNGGGPVTLCSVAREVVRLRRPFATVTRPVATPVRLCPLPDRDPYERVTLRPGEACCLQDVKRLMWQAVPPESHGATRRGHPRRDYRVRLISRQRGTERAAWYVWHG